MVLNTYQCYLKDSRFRLNADIESARRQKCASAAHVVGLPCAVLPDPRGRPSCVVYIDRRAASRAIAATTQLVPDFAQENMRLSICLTLGYA